MHHENGFTYTGSHDHSTDSKLLYHASRSFTTTGHFYAQNPEGITMGSNVKMAITVGHDFESNAVRKFFMEKRKRK